MLSLTCPVCGLEGEETAFRHGGEAGLRRQGAPGRDELQALADYLYMRESPAGRAHEMWQCREGCGKWFRAVRDTREQTFYAFERIDQPDPKT